MRFSRKTDYGVILVGELAPTFRSGSFRSLRGIAEKNHLPLSFLEKLAEHLRRAGFLEARRGQDGGYRLVKEPKKITLKELIDVFEEPKMMRCMHSPHPEKYCALVPHCPARKTWLAVEEKMNRVFEKVTLDTL